MGKRGVTFSRGGGGGGNFFIRDKLYLKYLMTKKV